MGEDGWIGRKGCLHVAEDSQHRGESGALAADGKLSAVPSFEPVPRSQGGGIRPQLQPAVCLLSWYCGPLG